MKKGVISVVYLVSLIAIGTLQQSLLGSVGYITLLQHKDNPKKQLILLGDLHKTEPVIYDIQKKVIDNLLEMAKRLKEPIGLLIECRKVTVTATEDEAMGLLIFYVNYILFYKQHTTPMLQPIACDVRRNIDNDLEYILYATIKPYFPKGYFNSYKAMVATQVTQGERYFLDIDQLKQEYKQNIPTFSYKGVPVTVTLSNMLHSITDHQKSVETLMTNLSIPDSLKAEIIQKITDNIAKAKRFVYSHTTDLTQNIGNFFALILEQDNPREKLIEMYKNWSYTLISVADVGMFAALVQYLQDNNKAILFAGALHTLQMEEWFKKLGYEIVHEMSPIYNIDMRTDEPFKFLSISSLNETGLLSHLTELAQKLNLAIEGPYPQLTVSMKLILAKDYYFGRGVKQNVDQAFHYYTELADQNEDPSARATAQARLGNIYYYGYGTQPRDLDKARYYYQLAAQQSDNPEMQQYAQSKLAELKD